MRACPSCGSALADESQPCRACDAALSATNVVERPATAGLPPEILAPGERFAGLEVVEVVGRGAMGMVYRAVDPQLGRDVALKLIAPERAEQPEFRRRFQREARSAARIEHPAVVPIYAAGEHDGRLFLSMRFIAGSDLAGLLSEGPLTPERALRLLAQVAGALDAAHARGLVHRDVKPANVLVSDESAYLADFGLALPERTDRPLTEWGRVSGTPAYIAPEQLRGEAVDGRADVYALGGVLYHCLTGEPPFPAERTLDVLSAHLSQVPPRASAIDDSLPAALDEVLARALSKDPRDRFATAGQLLQAAHDALRGRLPVPLARGNLPAVLPRLLGRANDLRRLDAALADDQIVTLTGAGGVGKTQLAIVAASAVRERFADGVYFVALESLTDPRDVPSSVAGVLGLSDPSAGSPLDLLTAQLRDRRLLLVLDNMEHLLDAAGDVARLADAAPGVRMLVTSQAPLRIARERVLQVRPLEVPDPDQTAPDVVAAAPAAALLVGQTQGLDADFEVTAANASALGELCRWLEGVPLALELAAPRLAVLTAAELLERLQRSVDALGPGRRDAPARHRSVRAMLEWTCSLLAAPEQQLVEDLSVFAGGFTPALVEHMLGDDPLESLGRLRDLRLVRRDAQGRLFLPPPVRVHTGERLRESGREHDARRRHAQAIVAVADPIGRNWFRGVSENVLDPDADNILAALNWTREHDGELHGRLVAATAPWMNMTARDALLRAEVDAALRASPGPRLRAELLMAQACLAEMMVPDPALADGAVAAWRELGDPLQHALALYLRSKGHCFAGNGPAAVADAQAARAIALRLDDPDVLDTADFALGAAYASSGDTASALEVADAMLARRMPGYHRASVLSLRGDALVEDRPREALADYADAVTHLKGIHQPQNLAFQLDGIAMGFAALGRDGDAARTAAIAQELRRAWFVVVPPAWEQQVHTVLAPALARLDRDEQRRCQAFATTMALAAAVDWAEQTARAAAGHETTDRVTSRP